jgi:hypothetical protein
LIPRPNIGTMHLAMYYYPLADLDPARKWMLICLAILTILYVVFRPLKKKKDPLARPPSFGALAQHRSVERQMQNVLVDLSEMARQITAQLDTRAGKLEALIKEADQKIAILKSLTPGESASPFAIPPPPADAPVDTPAPAPQSSPVDPRHAQVYTLADEGKSSREIAQQLNRPSGEVELILALREEGTKARRHVGT